MSDICGLDRRYREILTKEAGRLNEIGRGSRVQTVKKVNDKMPYI